MRKTFTPVLGLLFAAGLIAASFGCDDKKGAAGAGTTEAAATTIAAATTTAAAAPASAPPAAPTAVEVATAAPPGLASGPSDTPKVYDCGAKGQKPCPMQGWMKTNMAGAVAANDADKLAAALTTIAGKAPPGMGSWSSVASAGAAKAKAGDIDGAKASCKQCHDAFKETYKKTMRDRPF